MQHFRQGTYNFFVIIHNFAENKKDISADEIIIQLRMGQFSNLSAEKICNSI